MCFLTWLRTWNCTTSSLLGADHTRTLPSSLQVAKWLSSELNTTSLTWTTETSTHRECVSEDLWLSCTATFFSFHFLSEFCNLSIWIIMLVWAAPHSLLRSSRAHQIISILFICHFLWVVTVSCCTQTYYFFYFFDCDLLSQSIINAI